MLRYFVALLFALLPLSPLHADTTTLEVTSGVLKLSTFPDLNYSSGTDEGPLMGTGFSIFGAGFGTASLETGSAYVSFGLANPPVNGTTFLQSCSGTGFTANFTFAPLVAPFTEPFSMSGTLNNGLKADCNHDVVGQGVLSAWYPVTDFLRINFYFTPVPEPSSLLLLSAGFLGMLYRKKSRA